MDGNGAVREAYTAFVGSQRIATGTLPDVAIGVKQWMEREEPGLVLLFENETGQQIDIDLQGTVEEVLARIPFPDPPAAESPRPPGRPRLGVVAREVTLLPRHWEWLNAQPGGASVALRKLVETARRENSTQDRIRLAQEANYRLMVALAGNRVGFEEATRALFAGQRERFLALIADWPVDIRDFIQQRAVDAFLEGK